MSTPPTVYVSWQVALIDTLQQGFAHLAHTLTVEGQRMSEALDALTAQVERATTVMDSATVAFQGIVERLKDAGTDEAKLEALRADLEDNITMLSAAVATVPPAPPAP